MINQREIDRLAELAYLRLSKAELARMSRDETDVLDYVDRLKELKVDHIALVDERRRADLRPDRPIPFQDKDRLLDSFSARQGRFLKVPFVFGEQNG